MANKLLLRNGPRKLQNSVK